MKLSSLGALSIASDFTSSQNLLFAKLSLEMPQIVREHLKIIQIKGELRSRVDPSNPSKKESINCLVPGAPKLVV